MAVTKLNQANDRTGLPRRETYCPEPDQTGHNSRYVITRNGNDKITVIDKFVQEDDGSETQYRRTITRDGSDLITDIVAWVEVP
jgi:hypothetical protein